MISAQQLRLGAVVGLLLSLPACSTPDSALHTPELVDISQDQPALLLAPARDQLEEVVAEALGMPVLLADDTLTTSSRLIIERKAHRSIEHGRIMGTDLSGPIAVFTLTRNGEACVLVRRSDKSRWPVKDVQCKPE